MPIIKAAKKSMRQDAKRKARRFPLRSQLKTVYKKALTLIKDGNLEEAKKFLPFAYKIIDTAAKKNIIHPKNAGNKKSRIARELNALEKGGVTAEAPKKAEVKEEKAE